jgi:hypothetical protein
MITNLIAQGWFSRNLFHNLLMSRAGPKFLQTDETLGAGFRILAGDQTESAAPRLRTVCGVLLPWGLGEALWGKPFSKRLHKYLVQICCCQPLSARHPKRPNWVDSVDPAYSLPLPRVFFDSTSPGDPWRHARTR